MNVFRIMYMNTIHNSTAHYKKMIASENVCFFEVFYILMNHEFFLKKA